MPFEIGCMPQGIPDLLIKVTGIFYNCCSRADVECWVRELTKLNLQEHPFKMQMSIAYVNPHDNLIQQFTEDKWVVEQAYNFQSPFFLKKGMFLHSLLKRLLFLYFFPLALTTTVVAAKLPYSCYGDIGADEYSVRRCYHYISVYFKDN
jgi:hypothetical protein